VKTILIAVDGSEESVKTAQAAHRLFGDSAEYLVINVGPAVHGIPWGVPYPVMAPIAFDRDLWSGAGGADVDKSPADTAAERAAVVADAASLPNAAELGATGDPTTAILAAGRTHGADVVVVGSHRRSWLSRLLTPSVEHDVVKFASRPVLVVK
jgi:nucleotide-binding universal stress UspA family protein